MLFTKTIHGLPVAFLPQATQTLHDSPSAYDKGQLHEQARVLRQLDDHQHRPGIAQNDLNWQYACLHRHLTDTR